MFSFKVIFIIFLMNKSLNVKLTNWNKLIEQSEVLITCFNFILLPNFSPTIVVFLISYILARPRPPDNPSNR